MRKEIIFAIIAGISIGLIVAFGAWRVTKAIQKAPIATEIKKTPPSNGQNKTAISNLYDFDIVTENPVKLLGISTPLSDIVVSTTEDDFYTKTAEDGSFGLEVDLPAGASSVKVNDQKIILVYSTEFQKTEDSKLKSTSYIGTITDISSGNLQIKSDAGDIKQMSVTDNTAYINTLKKNAIIKSTDVALGDYIVAMGHVNGNKVLNASRILITSPLIENKYEAKNIIIEKLTKKMINDIVLPKTWKGPNVSDLEIGQEIYIVGTNENGVFSLRSILTPVE